MFPLSLKLFHEIQKSNAITGSGFSQIPPNTNVFVPNLAMSQNSRKLENCQEIPFNFFVKLPAVEMRNYYFVWRFL